MEYLETDASMEDLETGVSTTGDLETEALAIADKADFRELTKGYYLGGFNALTPCMGGVDPEDNRQQCWTFLAILCACFCCKTGWVTMKKPRPCYYRTRNDRIVDDRIERLRDGTVDAEACLAFSVSCCLCCLCLCFLEPFLWSFLSFTKTRLGVDCALVDGSRVIPKVEERGVTLRQLRAVKANADRRCVEEKWTDFRGTPLTPATVTLYDVNKYIILPFTVKTKKSFVESLPSTAGTQPPWFFVSHWWGEPIKDFLACVEQFVEDFSSNNSGMPQMTEDTPLWICAYANNQWELAESITKDPDESGFMRAMKLAKGRTISILDKDGIVFTRIWCIYELFKTLIDTNEHSSDDSGSVSPSTNKAEGQWAIYTAFPHRSDVQYNKKGVLIDYHHREAVGIVPGGAPAESGPDILMRERNFPFELVMKSLKLQVEKAEASIDSDRVHIFNAIIGNKDNLDVKPPVKHEQYTALNEALHASFATSIGSLQAALQHDDEAWKAMLSALSKGTAKGELVLNFTHGGRDGGWENLTTDKAVELVEHLPLTLKRLAVYGAFFGSTFVETLAEWISKSTSLEELQILFTYVGGKDGGQLAGQQIANALASSSTIKDIKLIETDLIGSQNAEHWAALLSSSQTLTSFSSRGLRGRIEKANPDKGSDQDSIGVGPCMLGDGGLKTIAAALGLNGSLTEVKLGNHGVGKEGFAALGPALMSNSTIEKVQIYEYGYEGPTAGDLKELQELTKNRSRGVAISFLYF